jgi:hypothetical protein
MDQSGRALLRSADRKAQMVQGCLSAAPHRITKQIRRGVHRSTGELEAVIKACIDATNAEPKPFRWTSSADDILVAVNRFCKRTIDEHHSALLKTSESGH